MLFDPVFNGDALVSITGYCRDIGRTETAKYLVEQGATIEAEDQYKRTPLHFASWKGQTETAKYLVEKGANIEAEDNDK